MGAEVAAADLVDEVAEEETETVAVGTKAEEIAEIEMAVVSTEEVVVVEEDVMDHLMEAEVGIYFLRLLKKILVSSFHLFCFWLC